MQDSALSFPFLIVAVLIPLWNSPFVWISGTTQLEAGHQAELFKVSKLDDSTFKNVFIWVKQI